jgi:hypothetical protein
LQTNGALAQPEVLRHAEDEIFFGSGGGLVLFKKTCGERLEFGGIFARDDELAGSEAVAEAVAGRRGLSLFSDGTGGTLRIRLIRGDLSGGRHCLSPFCELKKPGKTPGLRSGVMATS